jgi:hypothetical protein
MIPEVPAWLRWLGPSTANVYTLAVYAATRVPLLAGALTAYMIDPNLSVTGLATRWDSWWYLYIADNGYGHTLHPPVDAFHARFSTFGFFPGYPLLLRAVHTFSGIGLVLGLAALRAVYALGEAYGGEQVGKLSALLVAAWPGSAVLALPYSEGLYVAAAALCLWGLLTERWIIAGLAGLVASATRASGVALILTCLVVAWLQLVRHRRLLPLVAPILATLGIGSFLVFGYRSTGDPLIWLHAETLWHQHLDFSSGLVHHWAIDLPGRGGLGARALVQVGGACVLALFAVVVVLMRRHLTVALATYAAVTTFLVIGYSAVGPRPRMLLSLIPGFVWTAALLRPRQGEILALAFASMLALTAFLYLTVVVP